MVKSLKANELKELRQNDPQDLLVKMSDLKAELFNLRFQLATGQLENREEPVSVRRGAALHVPAGWRSVVRFAL